MSKQLTKFDTIEEYNSEKYFIDYPNVSKVNGSMIYAQSMPTDYAVKWIGAAGKVLGISPCAATASRPSGVSDYQVYGIEWGNCNTLTTLGESFFGQLRPDVTSVTVKEGITTIGRFFTYSSDGLASVTFPSTLTTLGGYTFNGCNSLTSLTVLATTPPTLDGPLANPALSGLNIYVPADSVEAYKAASYWSDYADRISAIQNNV